MSGIPMIYSAGTVDQWPKNVSSHLMYGGMWTIPVPDVRRTDLLVVMGANPHASQGSLLACPDVMGEIDGHPRRAAARSSSSTRAAPAPPSGPTSGCRSRPAPTPRSCSRSRSVLFAEDLVDLGAVADLIDGVDELRAPRAPTGRPSASRAVTGIAAERIRRARPRARRRPSGPSSTAASGCATRSSARSPAGWSTWSTSSPATSTCRAARCSRAPSAWPVTDLPMPGLEGGVPNFGRWQSRVRGAPEVLGHVPVSCLAEEIATPGEGQIRALFTVAGNPVLSTPGRRPARRRARRARLHDQRRQLDQRDHPPRRRDPPRPVAARAAAPRRPDLEFAVGSAAKYSRAGLPARRRPAARVGDPHPARRRLPRAAGGRGRRGRHRRRVLRRARRRPRARRRRRCARGYDAGRARAAARPHAAHRARSATATARCPTGSPRAGEGRAPRHRPRARRCPRLAEVVATADGKVVLAPPYITADLPRLAARLDRPADDAGADQPPPPPLEQLVDAQRDGAGEGQGPLHAARPPRRRRALRRGRRRRSPRSAPRPAPRGAGRGDRRASSPAWCRSRTGGATTSRAPGCRSPTSTPASTPTCSSPGDFVDVLSGNAAVNGIPVTVGRCRPFRGRADRRGRGPSGPDHEGAKSRKTTSLRSRRRSRREGFNVTCPLTLTA